MINNGSSLIRTLPSVQEFRLFKTIQFLIVVADFTAGGELHPALKTHIFLYNNIYSAYMQTVTYKFDIFITNTKKAYSIKQNAPSLEKKAWFLKV